MSEPALVATDAEKQSASLFKWILMLFPFGIFALGFVSIVIYLNGGFEEEVKRPQFERQASATALADNLKKMESLGERGFDSLKQRQALRGVMTMYQSALDIRNTGYEPVGRSPMTQDGEIWSWQVASLISQKRDAPRLIVAAAADGNPTAIAGLIALAQSFVAQKGLPVTLEFVLVPTRHQGRFSEQQMQEAVAAAKAADASTVWLWLDSLNPSFELICQSSNARMAAAANGIFSVRASVPRDGFLAHVPEANLTFIGHEQADEASNQEMDAERLVSQVKRLENLIQRWVSQR